MEKCLLTQMAQHPTRLSIQFLVSAQRNIDSLLIMASVNERGPSLRQTQTCMLWAANNASRIDAELKLENWTARGNLRGKRI